MMSFVRACVYSSQPAEVTSNRPGIKSRTIVVVVVVYRSTREASIYSLCVWGRTHVSGYARPCLHSIQRQTY